MRQGFVKLALGLTLAALVLLTNHAAAGPTVPHKESTDGKLTKVVNPTPINPLGTQTWVAQGKATHMGNYAEVGAHHFTAPNAQGIGQVLNGTFRSTAADGSTVAGTYAGTYRIVSATEIRYSVVAIYRQGTGRFVGVTGRANVLAVLDAATGNFHFDAVGTWTFP